MSADRLVLVIDDDADIREAVGDALEMGSFRVATAANGLEALERLRQASPLPSLILLDLMMPVMDGWAFLAEVQNHPLWANIPVVVISAHGSASALSSSVKARAHLSKPVGMTELLDTVERFARA